MHVLLCATPINDRAHQNDATSLTMYTTHTHDKYKYIYINVHRTCGKAIIGMALRPIIIRKLNRASAYMNKLYRPGKKK